MKKRTAKDELEVGARRQAPGAPGHSDRPERRGHQGHLRGHERNSCGRVRALHEDQELPLAHEWAALPRLPPAPRRAGRPDLWNDPIAERVRKIGGSTLKSIRHIARTQRVLDNDADYVTPMDMLAELRDGNKQPGGPPSRGARRVRRASRHRHRKPHRGVDRRDRATDLVPLRGRPYGRGARLASLSFGLISKDHTA